MYSTSATFLDRSHYPLFESILLLLFYIHSLLITLVYLSLDKKKQNVGTGLVGAPACGDVMRLQIEVQFRIVT